MRTKPTKPTKPAKRGPGRPARRPGETMVLVPIRMSEGERAAAHKLADARGMDVSALVRAWLAIGAPMPAAAPARPVNAPEVGEATPAASKPGRRASAPAKTSNRPKRGR